MRKCHINCSSRYYLHVCVHFPFFRIWEVSKDDLAGLHLKFGRDLWPLPRSQLHISHRISLLVHSQALWEGFGEISLILNVCNANFAWPDLRLATVFWNQFFLYFLDFSQKKVRLIDLFLLLFAQCPIFIKRKVYIWSLDKTFVQIVKYVNPNCKLYLSELSVVQTIVSQPVATSVARLIREQGLGRPRGPLLQVPSGFSF